MRRTLAALAALATLILPAVASADSLVFTKEHDVWLARPDGTGLYRVTTDGSETLPYRSPSQADDGTIVASHGNEIVRLRQNGELLSRFDPPPVADSTGAAIDGVPQHLAVSPDGSRIAFTYSRPSCPVDASCGVRQVLLYSYSDRLTAVSAFGAQTNRRNPSWVGPDRILLFGGAGAQVDLDAPGGGDDDAVHWFDDEAMEDLDDGELSRQGDRLAVLRSYGSNLHLAMFHVDGVGGAVQLACTTGADESLASPSWSPDGRSLAFADSDGIEVIALPDVAPGSCTGASSSHVVIPGGAEPDWGPAAVAPGSRPTSPSGAAPAAKPSLRLSAAKSAKVAQALRRGVVLRIVVPGAGRVEAQGTVAGRKIASGTATARRKGAISVRLRFAATAASRLRGKRSTRMQMKATFRLAGRGSALRVTGTIVLAR